MKRARKACPRRKGCCHGCKDCRVCGFFSFRCRGAAFGGFGRLGVGLPGDAGAAQSLHAGCLPLLRGRHSQCSRHHCLPAAPERQSQPCLPRRNGPERPLSRRRTACIFPQLWIDAQQATVASFDLILRCLWKCCGEPQNMRAYAALVSAGADPPNAAVMIRRRRVAPLVCRA